MAQRAQRIADSTRRRGFPVQDNEHRQQRLGVEKAGWFVSHNLGIMPSIG
jgi:hypothetical protein